MIVVIRESGCVEWTKKFKNIIIFNKGEPLSNEYNCIDIPNIGKEYHTIFTYIYDNYENLEDYIIFITVYEYGYGKICSNMLDKIEYYLNNNSNINFEFITNNREYLHTSKLISESEIENLAINVQNAYTKICSELFQRVEYIYIYKTEGSSFIVSKRIILARSKDFYLKIINILKDSEFSIAHHYVIDVIIQKIFMDRHSNFKIAYEYNGNVDDTVVDDTVIHDTVVHDTLEHDTHVEDTVIENSYVDTNQECIECISILESIPNCRSYFCSQECYNKIHASTN
jgi:hypothetical protein